MILVLLVAASSFGISRMLINDTVEQARPIAEKRDVQRRELALAEQREALVAARQDTLQKLLTTLEARIASNPPDSMVLISAGNIAYDLQEFGKASEYYKTFLENIGGNHTAVQIDYGFAVFQTGKQAEGIGILRSVLRAHPTNQTALFNLAFMYQQMGKADSTRHLLTACRDADPASAIGKNADAVLHQLATQTQ